MIDTSMVETILKAYREDECCILFLKCRIRSTCDSLKREKFKEDLRLATASKIINRKMLDQYYIHGITSEQIQKDIQP